MKTLYFVRHGEAETNVMSPRRVGGRSSWAELTPHGIDQARALGQRWRRQRPPCDLIAASTAVRAQQTARYCVDEAGWGRERIETYPELEELHQGDWTGKLYADVYTAAQIELIEAQQWYFRAPGGGESHDQVFERTADWIERKVLNTAVEHAWVFCHGLVIKLTLTGLTGLDRQVGWKIPIDNASITTLTYDRGIWSEVDRNDTSHWAHLCPIQ